MLAVTLGGIFIVTTLIGVITSGIEGKLDELRKGRSRVIESDHTVILGWSPQIFTIIGEIVLANANKREPVHRRPRRHDKVEMEDEIRLRLPTRRARRASSAAAAARSSSTDLAIVSPQTRARSSSSRRRSTIPTPTSSRRCSRSRTTRTGATSPTTIVAEIRDPRNLEVARLAAGDEAQLVLGGELIARITAQTCRQSGLSVVYMELLDFGGDEIYFHEEPELVGKTFGDALHRVSRRRA